MKLLKLLIFITSIALIINLGVLFIPILIIILLFSIAGYR